MDEGFVLNIGAEALKICIYIAGPMLIAAMITGIVVSIFQTITQINEATLTFIPKIFAVILVLVVMAPWMLSVLQEYTKTVFESAGAFSK